MPGSSFSPRFPLRGPHVQSALASAKWRGRLIRGRWGTLPGRTRERLLDCGDGVRLQGFITSPESPAAERRLVMLLHGWEGSVESTYILSLTRWLDRRGLAIFRLNFRDHGETHHLNPEIFHSCRLPEVLGAVKAVAELFPSWRLHLVGFSLGGNFALRVALRALEAAIPLAHVVAVSPIIDPAHGLAALERAPWVYQQNFLRKWGRSLRRKQRLFPDLHDFSECLRLRSVREMTRYLVERSGEFATLDDYLDGYSIAGTRLARLQVPATIITAADDPIIPLEDFEAIEAPGCLALEIQRRGGHCGFIENLALRSWIDARVGSILDR